MNLQSRKYILLIIWFGMIALGPITVLLNTSWSEAFSNNIVLTNFLQRITGLTAFTLISIQIVLGHWMNKWTQSAGSFAFRMHIVQGIFTYLLILIHPFLYSVITYQSSKDIIDAILVVVPSLKSQSEMYLTYGKLSFLLLTITVAAGYFRTYPFFRRNWLKLHVLNYFIFYSIFLHMRVGSDITSPPFVWFSWVSLLLVSYSAFNRFIFPIIQKYFKSTNAFGGQKA